jgi:hypothetical protein
MMKLVFVDSINLDNRFKWVPGVIVNGLANAKAGVDCSEKTYRRS